MTSLASGSPETTFVAQKVISWPTSHSGAPVHGFESFPLEAHALCGVDSLGQGSMGLGATLLGMDSLLLSKAGIVSFL